MTRITGDILIDRSTESVFDFVADERNEPRFNSRMATCSLESGAPIGEGSRFKATMGRGVPMVIAYTGYERPRRLASHSILAGVEFDGELNFEPEGSGTRMRWSWEVEAQGLMRLFGPVISRLGDRQEDRIWRNLKALLEDTAGPSASAGERHDKRVQPLVARARALRNWGATEAERAMVLPGDELVGEPADVTTRAVGIDAPVELVWRWLVQIGQDRGGMYSYDWLENLLVLHIHSVEQTREEWQHLAVGDRIRLVRKGWLGMNEGLALPVALVDAPRSLVLREQLPETPWDAVWSFHLLADGPSRCRLLSRGRSSRQRGLAWVAAPPMDAVTLLMTRKMLLGIKQRAEREYRSQLRGLA